MRWVVLFGLSIEGLMLALSNSCALRLGFFSKSLDAVECFVSRATTDQNQMLVQAAPELLCPELKTYPNVLTWRAL